MTATRVAKTISPPADTVGKTTSAPAVMASKDNPRLTAFDFRAEAELFPTRSRRSTRAPVGYKRFARAADAIRFAIEDLPPEFLVGAYLLVDEERFDGAAIRHLYESHRFPLARRAMPK
jgi:hypothetical protein